MHTRRLFVPAPTTSQGNQSVQNTRSRQPPLAQFPKASSSAWTS